MSGLHYIRQDFKQLDSVAELFPSSEEGIKQVRAGAVERAEAALETIYVVPAAERTFGNTPRVADLSQGEFSVAMSVLSVVMNTAKDKQIRDVATKELVALQSRGIDLFGSNRALHKCLVEYRDSAAAAHELDDKVAEQCGIMAERKYWYDQEIREFRRRGLELPEAEFQKAVTLQKDLTTLVTEFNTNIAEDRSTLLFTKEQLLGVPQNVLESLKRDDSDKIIVKLDYPTYNGIMKNCEVAATRKEVMIAYEKRAFPQNQTILQEIIGIRHELSTLLGYRSFTEFDLESKMVKTPEVAYKFLADLVPGLQSKWNAEIATVLEKGDLHPSVKLTPEDQSFQYYDILFMMNDFKKKQLHVSETEIQEYFPMESTVDAIFSIYQKFFDVTFTKHSKNGSTLDTTSWFWDDAVEVLTVTENVKEGDEKKKEGRLLGHIVLDLFPREGKYSHACCHSVVPPCRMNDEEVPPSAQAGKNDENHASHHCLSFSPAVCVVLANFPGPTEDKPALFMHDDVRTFFHEFGHAIHSLLGRSNMVTFAGTSRVKRDFVELPSQILEEWLWDESILAQVTKHYKTGAPLPKELIQRKVASQRAFSGRDTLRQLQFAMYSLHLFDETFASSGRAGDPAKLFLALLPPILPHIRYNQEGHTECSFGHLMGYGACYYGYLWAEVIATDIFKHIKSKKDGLLSPAVGRKYVQSILGVGGGKDPYECIQSFLGREPSNAAFLEKLGLRCPHSSNSSSEPASPHVIKSL